MNLKKEDKDVKIQFYNNNESKSINNMNINEDIEEKEINIHLDKNTIELYES